MTALLWFRRDLRIQDNPALLHALSLGVNKAVFLSAPAQWEQHNLAPIQAHLITRQLNELKVQLGDMGVELVHLRCTDYDSQVQSLIDYCRDGGYDTVVVNRELEFNELQRDEKVASELDLISFQSDTIAPLGYVVNKQGEMYKVFTPFKHAWLKYISEHGIEVSHAEQNQHYPSATEQEAENNNDFVFDYPMKDSTLWPSASRVVNEVVPHFMSEKVSHYSRLRDIPSVKGTSGLSPYLAIGAISSRHLAHTLISHDPELLHNESKPEFSWLNELIWRDFYKHLLFHYPNLVKGECFNPKYANLNWPHREDLFQAWCEGRTGYPIVDAAMRQLVKTGWMHNRLRMITASFLTKHLLIDWRHGEKFFMQHLIDGDFSANNGGWQWASSVGCDAQPYFRIFNPITQSKKFDPKGIFLRKYLPELANIPDKEIHFPHSYLEKINAQNQYWAAIVDHKEARARALDFFKQP